MPDSYFPLDVNFADHPKVIGLSDAGVRVWAASIAYANRYMTDGYVAQVAVSRLHDCDWSSEDDTPKTHAAELVAAGLWHEADVPCPRGHDDTCPKLAGDGFRIHDFLEHNRSKAKRLEAQKQERDRKAAWRQRQRESRDGPASTVTPLSRGTPASRGRSGDAESRDRDRDKIFPTHPEELSPPRVIHTASVENPSTPRQQPRRAKLVEPQPVGEAVTAIAGGRRPPPPPADQRRWREERDKRAAAERLLAESGDP